MEEVTGICHIDNVKQKLYILLLLTFCSSVTAKSQSANPPTGFWKLYSYAGEARMRGIYRKQLRIGNLFEEQQESKLFSTGLLVRTKSYIWHPKFITIDLDGEYSPAKAEEKFLAIPDQTENKFLQKIDARLTFLPQNKFSITSYFNYGRLYNNRENLSSIKSTGTNWGTVLFYRPKKIPFSIGYTNWKQEEAEVLTGRRFQNKQQNLEGRASTSFGKTDRQELMVAHNEFFRKDYDKFEVSNKINNVNYSSLIPFGKKQKNNMNTFLSGAWQSGSEKFDRYQAIENISWQLSRQFRVATNYMYFSDQRPRQSLYQHKIGSNLHHQLFESLHTMIGYEYDRNIHSVYNSQLHQATGEITYTKRIFKKNNLDLAYRYNIQAQNWKSADGVINIFNEAITLQDGQITLLSRPSVIPGSIRVKDVTGTTIYQLNLDYLLVNQNDFIQIQRIPGGLIQNNTIVYIDYSVIQPGSYQYTGNNYQASAGLSFFNHLFGVYYRKSVQDYRNLRKTDFITLNYFDQQVMGAKVDYKYLSCGVEYDNMKSSVLPYQLLRYYVNMQGTIKNKMIIALNVNLYDYKKLNNISNIQFFDASGSAAYYFSPRTTFTTSASLRKQTGQNVDLDLFNFITEFSTSVQRLGFSVSYNYYDRIVFNEKINFNSINVQVSRKF